MALTRCRPHSPWFEGSSTSSKVPYVLPVSIDGHAFQIDLAHFARETLSPFRGSVDGSAEPTESSLNQEAPWRRTASSWHVGAGQNYFDVVQESIRERFRTSQGVDPWTRRELRLLPDVDQLYATTGTGLKLLPVAGFLYLVDGSVLSFLERAHLPNLLSDGEDSFEASVAGWTPAGGTFTQVTTNALDGTKAGELAAAGAGPVTLTLARTVAVAEKMPFTLVAQAATVVGAPRIRFEADQLAADGTVLATAVGLDATGTLQVTLAATAATGTVALAVRLVMTADGAGDSIDVDEVGVFGGATTDWVPGWRTVDLGNSGPITDLTSDGLTLYAACTSEVRQIGVGALTGGSQLVAYAAVLIRFCNGRLVAAKNGELVEITHTGGTYAAGTPFFTHFNVNFAWTDILATPNGIYCAGNLGDRAEVFYVGVNQTNGALLPGVPAMPLPPGEKILALAYYDGAVFCGTSKGWRLAQVAGGNFLTHGPLVTAPGPVTAMDGQGQYVWFSWSNLSPFATGLGRADLAQFAFSNTPAYASDLMAADVQGTVSSVASFGDRRFFTVDGAGVFAQADRLVPAGEVDSGWIGFGLPETSTVVSVDVHHRPLHGSVRLAIAIEADPADGGTLAVLGGNAVQGSTKPATPIKGAGISGQLLEVRTTLVRDLVDPTEGPVLQRVTLRAIPAPERVDEIILPIILKSVVSTLDDSGADTWFDALGEFLFLKGLEANGQIVSLKLGGISIPVTVSKVSQPEGSAEKWNDDRTATEGTVYVRCLTVETRT